MDFIEAELAEKTQAATDKLQRIILSERDYIRFVEMIDNPMPATPELQKAMADYRSLQSENPDANL